MGTFDAEVVEDLAYDFSKWGGSKGVIPEPSQKAMKRYQQSLSRVQLEVSKSLNDLQNAKMEDVDEAMIKRLEEAADEADAKLSRELAKLCQDRPSEADFEKLPFRVKQQFVKWITNELAPEGGASGTTL